MLKIAVVDDEDDARNKIINFINLVSSNIGKSFNVIPFSNAFDLLESKDSFDILFFDIQMPQMDGYTAVKKIREKNQSTIVIFVTSLAQYAVKGYEVDALDFLLKPLQYDDFEYRFKKVLKKLPSINESNIRISFNGVIQSVSVDEILYLETSDRNIKYVTERGVYREHKALKEAIKQIRDDDFIRCNYSTIVNVRKITNINKEIITLVNGEKIYMSRSKKATVKERFSKIKCR